MKAEKKFFLFNILNIKSAVKLLFITGIFFSAFIYWPQAEIEYEIPKVWFILRWLEVVGFISLVFGTISLKKQNLDSRLIGLIVLFVVVSFAASCFGVDFGKSLAGNYYRQDGLLTLTHFMILFFVVSLFSDRLWISDFMKTVSLSGMLLGLWVLSDYTKFTLMNLPVDNWYGAYGGPFGNPNFLSGYLVLALPFTAYFLTTIKPKLFKSILITGLMMQITGILLTYAWAGIFGIIIFIFGWGYLHNRNSRRKYVIFGSAVFIALCILYIISVKKSEVPNRINAEGRDRIITKGLMAWTKRPVFGYGWSNFDYAFKNVDYPIHIDNDVYVDKAHSSFLEILTTTGLAGFIAYILIITRTVFSLWKRQETVYKYLLFGFVITVLHMQTNVISISEELIFWTIIGFASIKNSEPRLNSLI
jgi:O-antigen ligase